MQAAGMNKFCSKRVTLPTLTQSVVRRSRCSSRTIVTAMASVEPKKILMMGGTRFIGVYLARMLIDQGHEVTLYTRGKSPITSKIPDDTDESYEKFSAAVKHIAGDRKDYDDVKKNIH
eukprot:TRINITY_DN3300_c0_g1_i11.p3 TRINITY_DN3300_c0_g1~~TRINITY_DN3300_c0_g1_i11.p3  ORF type:complete len:118 (+),score=8.12 TRINITY_DN3300_c0_g1_i11:60-413(+)